MTAYRVEVRVLKDDKVLKSWDYVPEVHSEQGYECSHDWHLGEAEEAACGWCESQGHEGAFEPITVVQCPLCDATIKQSHVVAHWSDECGT